MHEARWLSVYPVISDTLVEFPRAFFFPFLYLHFFSFSSRCISVSRGEDSKLQLHHPRSYVSIRRHHAARFNVDLTLKLNYRWITESLWIVIAHLDDMNYSLLFVPATISLIALQTPRYTFSRNIEICIVIQQRWRGNIFIARSLRTFHRA